MIQTESALAVLGEDLLDPIEAFDQRLDFGEPRRVLHIDMGDLVIGEREGIRSAGIQNFASETPQGARGSSLPGEGRD